MKVALNPRENKNTTVKGEFSRSLFFLCNWPFMQSLLFPLFQSVDFKLKPSSYPLFLKQYFFHTMDLYKVMLEEKIILRVTGLLTKPY